MSTPTPTRLEYQPLNEDVGLRIDKVLANHPEIQSRNRALQLIESGRVWVNGVPAKASYLLKATDQIVIELPPPKSTTLEPYNLPLEILFEDRDLIVLNKPSGLVVHPAAGHEQETLVNALIHHAKDFFMKFGEERPGIVHRLDKDTSGLLVVAKNDESQRLLVDQFRQRSIHRIYYAACLGVPKINRGRITSTLIRHPQHRQKYTSYKSPNGQVARDPLGEGAKGKWAATNYELVARVETSLSLLKVKLETGRTHQIRVHLSENGLPLWKDDIYGSASKEKNLPSSVKSGVENFPRLALHAAELGFRHPKTNQEMHFHVNWPDLEQSLLTEVFGESAIRGI